MSHFTVLVIGDNPEKQLEPFDESLKVEWVDKTEEYKEEYETKKVDEFFCSSSSSWGFQITKELFDFIKSNKAGSVKIYEAKKLDPMHYLTQGKKYRGYYTVEPHKRCEGDAWFEVEEVMETTHPDKNICFEGVVRIRVIDEPKEILLKEKYPDYETYLKNWHGLDDIKEQGYWTNPKGHYDWFSLGGRWTGFFKLKPNESGTVGKQGLMTDPAKEGYVDQAFKKAIDFKSMYEEKFEMASKDYDEFEKVYKENPEDGVKRAYWDFGVENTSGDRENFIPETREQYLERRGGIITFAVVKDGEWYARGKMGWFGCSYDEKDPNQWNREFKKLLEELPDDTLLSLYDCHC